MMGISASASGSARLPYARRVHRVSRVGAKCSPRFGDIRRPGARGELLTELRTDHDGWRIEIRADRVGHDGRIRDPEILDPAHAQIRIDHRLSIRAHATRSHRMT